MESKYFDLIIQCFCISKVLTFATFLQIFRPNIHHFFFIGVFSLQRIILPQSLYFFMRLPSFTKSIFCQSFISSSTYLILYSLNTNPPFLQYLYQSFRRRANRVRALICSNQSHSENHALHGLAQT